MKILIAPNSMKGSLGAFDFAETVEKAFLSVSRSFETRKVPVADGGDFTGQVLKQAFRAIENRLTVLDPLGRKTEAEYFTSGKTAIIEMAEASGMGRMDPHSLNPMKASSFGTGQLIADALVKGCDEIILAIGGSATVDGGMGVLQALGFQFFEQNGNKLSACGGNLSKVARIAVNRELPQFGMKIVCDVDNPLLGDEGAAHIFGPQKGATPEMVPLLEIGLESWSAVIGEMTGKNLSNLPGAGAAGGIAVPLIAFFEAEIVPGANFVLSQLQFETHVQWADLVITGEGKIDAQTLNNKAPFAVAKMAKHHNKPVFALAGKIEKKGAEMFDGAFSISNGAADLQTTMQGAKSLLFDASVQLAKTIHTLKP